MKLTLGEIASQTGARLEGDPAFVIEGAAGLSDAGPRDISFLENMKYGKRVASSRAGAVIMPPSSEAAAGGPKNRLYSEQPKWAYAQILARVYAEKWPLEPALVSDRADVHASARLDKGVAVGAFAVIRDRASIGGGTRISAQCYVGKDARIGKNCLLHPQVFIGDYCELGDKVEIHPGTVIGSDGYGYCTDPKTGEHRKLHQVGKVVIEDDVEIGSNVSIDRATTGETRIGKGTKIDNLVQLGHNVTTGRNCLIVSQVGVSGSTKLGHQVVLAGQAGIIGHISIGDGAVITAQTGVMNDVAPKEILFGSPARPHREAMKIHALLAKLPELCKALKSAATPPKEAARAKR